ncbi:MAG TPA: CBS and ACT domain-containing protein [Chloroflexaceae bacterium]|nr:CBS and ACT domain-containing protein [Chloroflexaceae bacterium]
MFVGERMNRPVISVSPETPVNDALHLMRSEHIRRAPVVSHGKLVGIVSMKDLLNASPSNATTLSVWELNYLLSKLTVERTMTREVFTVAEDTPIEEAARLMADKRVGGLPVVRGGEVVGMITETDLFKIFLELMGARDAGIRCEVRMRDEPGQLASLTGALAGAGGNIIALGTFAGESPGHSIVTFKVSGLTPDEVRALITPVVESVTDVRVTHP